MCQLSKPMKRKKRLFSIIFLHQILVVIHLNKMFGFVIVAEVFAPSVHKTIVDFKPIWPEVMVNRLCTKAATQIIEQIEIRIVFCVECGIALNRPNI